MRIAFEQPEFLALLPVVALLAVALVAAWRGRLRAVRSFAGPGAHLVSTSSSRQLAKLGLAVLAMGCLVVVLARPEAGAAPRPSGVGPVDVVIALDVSQSMAARDVAPDRLHEAQAAVAAVSRRLAGERVGLVLFARNAVARYPLTSDTKVLSAALDSSGRGFRIAPGTVLQSGLDAAAATFPSDAAEDKRAKAVLLISDGEDFASNTAPPDSLRQRGIPVFTLGIGTTVGAPVPVYDAKGGFIQFLVDANGSQVTSRLDPDRLKLLAETGGGRYWQYDGDGTADDVGSALRRVGATAAPTADADLAPEDRYQIVLAVALLALLAELLIDERRPMPRPLQRGRGARRSLYRA